MLIEEAASGMDLPLSCRASGMVLFIRKSKSSTSMIKFLWFDDFAFLS